MKKIYYYAKKFLDSCEYWAIVSKIKKFSHKKNFFTKTIAI